MKPRFSTRALLLLMALVAAPLAFHGYQLSWIRQRHSAIESGQVDFITSDWRILAPFPLRLYGEPGYHRIYALAPAEEQTGELKRRLASLFPEAKIYIDTLRPPESFPNRTP